MLHNHLLYQVKQGKHVEYCYNDEELQEIIRSFAKSTKTKYSTL